VSHAVSRGRNGEKRQRIRRSARPFEGGLWCGEIDWDERMIALILRVVERKEEKEWV
jgi:hypothetical protein